MASFIHFDSVKQPRSKVELHVHLDGAVRLTTIWELALKKGIKLKSRTLEKLYEHCRIRNPSTLEDFLKPFSIFLPVIAGDAEALERIAYEFCEDSAKQGILYSEVRFSPHLLLGTEHSVPSESPITARDVVECIIRGFSRGSVDFNITVRSILSCIRGKPEWSNEVLDLCLAFKDHGVVGIDVAGDEALELASCVEVDVFKRAAEAGIHRTVHAGEAGPASNVQIAVSELLAERIGHGYHVVDDPTIYADIQQSQVHFETCPYSSYLTGSVPLGTSKHPIVKFAEDSVNFSLSRDDPCLIQRSLDEEYQLVRDLGLKDVHIVRANFNAARSCFLPEKEKTRLLQHLAEIYGTLPQFTNSTKSLPYTLSAASFEASED